MVEMRRSESELSAKRRAEFPVKLEIVEDDLEEEHGPLNKRSRLWSSGTSSSPMAPAKYNPLDEPSPLGLSLRKSPSLLDLIQMRLTQSGDSKAETMQTAGVKKESKCIAAASAGAALAPGSIEKLKASNFPASVLKIGKWEYKSRYEGDLVAKCYFAKHKLVWEVLEQGLKSKIEIQWSDIVGLKANCPEDGPGTLTLVLSRQPLFFRETNPQPRKHTLWQATSDFTDGQASLYRKHFLQCAQGIMNKHFEKLVQCDHRLFHLSREPEIIMDFPYFDARQSIFEDPSESKGYPYGNSNLGSGPSIASPVGAQSSSEHMYLSHEAPSPSSVIDARANEGGIGGAEAVNSRNTTDCGQIGLHKAISLSDFLAVLGDSKNTMDSNQVEEEAGLNQSMSVSDLVAFLSDSRNITDSSQIKVPGLQQSISVSDFVGLLSDSAGGNHPEHLEKFEILKQQLLSDNIQFDTPDEKSLMPRVNSLFNLLYKDPSVAANSQLNTEVSGGFKSELHDLNGTVSANNNNRVLDPASSSKPQGMLRKDSFSDLLLHLPRITSLPKFLSNISVSLSFIPSLTLPQPPSLSRNATVPRRCFSSIRCGPRDNRGPLLKGRILSSEAIQSIQSLKRAHRTGSLSLSLPPLRRLLKADLLAVVRELLRQDHCTLAVHVLSTLRSEYPPLDLTLYADVVNALARNGEREEIDRLIGEMEGIEGGYEKDKALAKLIRAVMGAERREAAVRIYGMMREGGWGSESWEADEYVAEVLSKGLRRLGEEELAAHVASTQRVRIRT